MFCLVGFAALLGPRLAVAIWWLFGNKVELAFDSWIWPLLGSSSHHGRPSPT